MSNRFREEPKQYISRQAENPKVFPDIEDKVKQSRSIGRICPQEKANRTSQQIIPVNWILQGTLEFEIGKTPVRGYSILLWAPKLVKEKPVAQGITNREGRWKISLSAADYADRILKCIRSNRFPPMTIEVLDPRGKKISHNFDNKSVDPTSAISLTIVDPKYVKTQIKTLQVSGQVLGVFEKNTIKKLQIEVWDRYSHQERALAHGSIRKDDTFNVTIPSDKALSYFSRERALWLRAKDSKTGTIITYSNSPLKFDDEGRATQDLRLPAQMPAESPKHKMTRLYLKLSQQLKPNDVSRLEKAGLATFKDLFRVDPIQIAKQSKVNIETIKLLRSLGQSVRTQYGSKFDYLGTSYWIRDILDEFVRNRDFFGFHFDVQDRDSAGGCVLPKEETWEYRFTPHEGYTDNDAINDYVKELEPIYPCDCFPYWRGQKIYDFLNTYARQSLRSKMNLLRPYNAVVATLGTYQQRNQPLFFLSQQPLFEGPQPHHNLNGPILTNLRSPGGAAQGPDDLSNNLHAQILDRSENVLNFQPPWTTTGYYDPDDPLIASAFSDFRVFLETATSPGNAGTVDTIGYFVGPWSDVASLYWLFAAPPKGVEWYWDLTTVTARVSGGTHGPSSPWFWGLGSAIQACDRPHTLVKWDEDGWNCENWRVQIRLLHPLKRIHPDHDSTFDPTTGEGERSFDLGYHPVLNGINSSRWFDCKNGWDEGFFTGSCQASLELVPWPNHLRDLDDDLKQFAQDLYDFVSDLTKTTDYPLSERLDEILQPVLEGNQHYVREEYEAAVGRYRKARERLEKVQAFDKNTYAYRRLKYVLSLHIGDAYWGHREYERAIHHFLNDTCPKRNSLSFDDHFLWNHIAECRLDWADRRYRLADQHYKHRIDFPHIEKIDSPISADPDLYFRPENQDGAYKLYKRVLARCLNCGNRPPAHSLLYEYLGNYSNIFIAVNFKKTKRKNNDLIKSLRGLGLRINEKTTLALSSSSELAKKYKAQVVFVTSGRKPIAAQEIKQLTIFAAENPLNQTLRLTNVNVYGVHIQSGQSTVLLDSGNKIYEWGPLQKYIDLGVHWLGVCDLTPTAESDCGTPYSDILLLRAQIGVESIDACENALGLRDDFVPVYRYEHLRKMANAHIETCNNIASAYVSARQMFEATTDREESADNAVRQAQIALDMENGNLGIATLNREIANGRITALANQRARLNEELTDAGLAGPLVIFASTVQGAGAGAMAADGGGAIAGGLLSAFTSSLNTMVNLGNLANDIDRRQQGIDDETDLAIHERDRANIELGIQENRQFLADFQYNWLFAQAAKFSQDNYRNPEIWLKIADVYKRLLHIAMARTIYLAWSAQKAIEFEIGVDPNSPDWANNLIQFDYLDQIDDGETFAAATGASTAEVTYATGTNVLQIHLAGLDVYRHNWYQSHTLRLTHTPFSLKDDFPVQYHQLVHTPGTEDEVTLHFSTPIWVFDNKNRGRHAYGQIVYVEAVYKLGIGGSASHYSIRLYNTHRMKEEVTPDFNRYYYSGFSYWRVPVPSTVRFECQEVPYDPDNPDHNVILMDDWVNYDIPEQTIQPWILKAKLTSALYPDSNIAESPSPPEFIKVSNDADTARETLDSLKARFEAENFLFEFENTGLHTDWTLVLNNTTGGTLPWTNIGDVEITIFWKSSSDGQLEGLVDAQLDNLYNSRNYVRNFRDDGSSVERTAFLQIFDNDHFYTEQTGDPDNRIDFTIPNAAITDVNPKMKGVYFVFVFDDATMSSGNIPTLKVRLTKEGIVDGGGLPVELVFTSPSVTAIIPFVHPAEYVDQDPAGVWHFQMLANPDNLDPADPAGNINHAGLLNFLLVIEYEYD